MEQEKTCSKCGEQKPLSKFGNDSSKKDGKRPSCRPCKAKTDKLYKQNNSETVKKIGKKYYDENKEKIKNYSKDWYKNNIDHCRKVRDDWYKNNTEKVNEIRKKNKEENSEFYKEYHRAYNNNRYKTNLNYRIKTITNKRIRDYVRKKNAPTLEILGCSIEEFKIWIEFQFDEYMNWENLGKYWSFDHVIPCASFDLQTDSEIKKCYNWTNLRPLKASLNSSKGSKIIKEVIDAHKTTLENFLNNNIS